MMSLANSMMLYYPIRRRKTKSRVQEILYIPFNIIRGTGYIGELTGFETKLIPSGLFVIEKSQDFILDSENAIKYYRCRGSH